MSGKILVEKDGPVCTMTLQNEGKRNAISYEMMDKAISELDALESSPTDYVLVLTGAGSQAFSAGFDLSQERDESKEDWWRGFNNAIEEYEFATIAMLNGLVYGGAVELMSACDIRVGLKQSNIAITPARIGIVYGPNGITRVQRLIGPAKTKEMLFTGSPISGQHASDVGLFNYAVENQDQLTQRTYDIADTIAGNAPISIKHMKTVSGAIDDQSGLSQTEKELARGLRQDAFQSDDYHEGIEAFREGRDPDFTGE